MSHKYGDLQTCTTSFHPISLRTPVLAVHDFGGAQGTVLPISSHAVYFFLSVPLHRTQHREAIRRHIISACEVMARCSLTIVFCCFSQRLLSCNAFVLKIPDKGDIGSGKLLNHFPFCLLLHYL